MIEMVTFHGEVDQDHEFFATLSGSDIHRRSFMKEDARGLHFFSHGNEILLTPEGKKQFRVSSLGSGRRKRNPAGERCA